MFASRARAILWAQFRTLLHFTARGSNRGGVIFTIVMSAVWYGLVAFGAWSISVLLATPQGLELARVHSSQAFFLAFLYWQIIPLLMGAAGAQIDLKKLTAYPVTPLELFLLEVLLRFTTGVEVLFFMAGAATGIVRNPAIPLWHVLGFLPWIVFNLFLATGLRDLIGRLLAGRRTREVFTLVLVLLMATPQLIAVAGPPDKVRQWLDALGASALPWAQASRIVLDSPDWRTWFGLFAWVAGAIAFGWNQFMRGLRFDADAARSAPSADTSRGWSEVVFRLPSRLFADPLGAMVEKELRFLSRAPRFRLVFIMGFSFGLLLWLPMMLRGGDPREGLFGENNIIVITLYALMLLGEVLFWNAFGFDRGAALFYYLTPAPFSRVLAAKNLAAVFFVLLEVTLVLLACFAAGVRVPLTKAAEAAAVTLVVTVYLLAVGNLGSVYYPRPVDPARSWKSASAGRLQALFVFIYPVLLFPVVMAYTARWALDAEWAFWAVLAFAATLGGVIYWVAMDSAVQHAARNREQFVTALAAGDGPVTA